MPKLQNNLTLSRSCSNLAKQQIVSCLEQFRAKTRKGYDIIQNGDRSSKIKTIYQQIQVIDNHLQKLCEKNSDLNFVCNRKLEQQMFFISFNLLPYIQGQKSMSKQQSHSTVVSSEAETPEIDSLPTVQNGWLSEEFDSTGNATVYTGTWNGQTNNQNIENIS